MDGELTPCPPFVIFTIYRLQYASYYLIILPYKCTHNASHNSRPEESATKRLRLDCQCYMLPRHAGKRMSGPAQQTSCASGTLAHGQNLIWLSRETQSRKSAPFTCLVPSSARLVSLRLFRVAFIARGRASDSAALVTCFPRCASGKLSSWLSPGICSQLL